MSEIHGPNGELIVLPLLPIEIVCAVSRDSLHKEMLKIAFSTLRKLSANENKNIRLQAHCALIAMKKMLDDGSKIEISQWS